jgi:hypothetical protein
MSDEKSNVIQFRPSPKDMGTAEVNALWDFAVALMHSEAQRLMNPETMFGGLVHPALPSEVPDRFLTTRNRHDYEFDPASSGGWYCRSKNYDGPGSPIGWGKTQKDALMHYLDQTELELPATAAERELDEAIDDGITFDDGLTDDDAR